jgi:hypothetical protein
MPRYENITKYDKEWSITKPILEKLNVDLSNIAKYIAMPITEEDVIRASIIYAMEINVLRGSANSLLNQFSQYYSKIHFFGEIEDKIDDLEDCGGSEDKERHLIVNRRIVLGIRNNRYKILNNINEGGQK